MGKGHGASPWLPEDISRPKTPERVGVNLRRTRLRQEENLGGLEAGKFANIIGVRDDPLDDIEALRGVSLVIKGGKTGTIGKAWRPRALLERRGT